MSYIHPFGHHYCLTLNFNDKITLGGGGGAQLPPGLIVGRRPCGRGGGGFREGRMGGRVGWGGGRGGGASGAIRGGGCGGVPGGRGGTS